MSSSTLYKYSVFLSAWSIFFYGYFFRNSISPIVDVLEEELDTTATGIGFLGSFIHFMYFMWQIPFGILTQFVPGRHILPAFSFVLGVTIFLFSISNNVIFGTITSALCGFAMAPSWLCFVRIIDDVFTRAQVPFVIGVQMTMTYGGLFALNYVQAEIYQRYNDWRTVFIVLSIACFVSGLVLMTLFYVHHRKMQWNDRTALHRNESLTSRELADLAKGSKTTTDQTRLLSESKTCSDSDSKQKINEMVRAFKRGFSLKWNWILSLWGFSGLCLVNGFIGLWFISYLMIKFGYSRSTASLISGSFYLLRAVSAPIYGRLAMKYSKRVVFLVFGSCLWICTLIIVYVLQSDAMLGVVITLNFVSGFGAGSWGIMWCLQREYNAYYNCKDMAAGLVNTLINAAGFVTQLLIGEVLDIRWVMRDGDVDENGVREYNTADYDYALLVLPAVVFLAVVSALLLKETNGENLDYSDSQKKATNCV